MTTRPRTQETCDHESWDTGTETRFAPGSGQQTIAGDDRLCAPQRNCDQTRHRIRQSAESSQAVRQTEADELEQLRRYACIPLLRDLLPIIDDLRRAVLSTSRAAESAASVEDFEFLLSQFDRVLREHDVQELKVIGKTFDSAAHESAGRIPSDEPKGTVIQVLQPGYSIDDRLVRPARVIVSSGPPARR